MTLDDCPEATSQGDCKFADIQPNEQIWLLVVFILAVIVPIMTTIFLYTGLLNKVKFIRQSISSIGRTSTSNNNGDLALRRSIRLFSAALIISWLPLLVYKMVRYFELDLGPKFCLSFGRIATMLPMSREGAKYYHYRS